MSNNFLVFAIVTVICLWINGGEAIKGGKPANVSEYPYVVAILRNGIFVCSGAIIHKRFVITAATCLIDDTGNLIAHPIKVITGVTEIFRRDMAGHYINTTEYESKHDKAVKGVFSVIYPRYYDRLKRAKQDYREDYLFLKLNENLVFAPDSDLKKIDLADDDTITYANKDAIVMGYGYDNAGSNGPVRLNTLETQILPNDFYGKDKAVDKSLIIAYSFDRTDGDKHGPCRGDLGAPLVYGTNKLIGIQVAGPSDCGKDNEVYYYTRISSHEKAMYFPLNTGFLRHYFEFNAH